MKKLLLTGFVPFLEFPINPTEQIAKNLDYLVRLCCPSWHSKSCHTSQKALFSCLYAHFSFFTLVFLTAHLRMNIWLLVIFTVSKTTRQVLWKAKGVSFRFSL